MDLRNVELGSYSEGSLTVLRAIIRKICRNQFLWLTAAHSLRAAREIRPHLTAVRKLYGSLAAFRRGFYGYVILRDSEFHVWMLNPESTKVNTEKEWCDDVKIIKGR
jgi:hypothetical protein